MTVSFSKLILKEKTTHQYYHFTLGYQINVGLRLLNHDPFSQAYVLIRYPTFINFPTHAGTKLRTSSVLKSYKYLCTTYSVLIHKRCE